MPDPVPQDPQQKAKKKPADWRQVNDETWRQSGIEDAARRAGLGQTPQGQQLVQQAQPTTGPAPQSVQDQVAARRMEAQPFAILPPPPVSVQQRRQYEQQGLQVEGTQQPQQPQQQDLATLQAHGMGVSGVPGYSQGMPPVDVRAPDVRLPRLKAASQEQIDQQTQHVMDLADRQGRIRQQGYSELPTPVGYDAIGNPVGFAAQGPSRDQLYSQGRGDFMQSLAQASEDDRQRLMRELGLGELAVKKGGLDVEAQKAAAQQALGRAELSSKEGMAAREITSKEKLAGLDLANKELLSRMGILGGLEQEHVKGAHELERTMAQQKGINAGALNAAWANNPETTRALNAGGKAALDLIDRQKALSQELSAGPGLPEGASTARTMDPALQRFLYGGGSQVPMPNYGQQVGVYGQPPQIRPVQDDTDKVRVAQASGQAFVPQVGGQAQQQKQSPRDVITQRGQETEQHTSLEDLRKTIGDLKGKKAKDVIDALKGHVGRISDDSMDKLITDMNNAGNPEHEVDAQLINELQRLQANIGHPQGAPFRAVTHAQSYGDWRDYTPGIKPMPDRLQVIDPEGNPVYEGESEHSPFAQMRKGSRDVFARNFTGSGNAEDLNRMHVLQHMLQRQVARKKQR